ncbi:MAG: NAD(P)-dependent dehydrogenase, short-chain alcohol dehydrogenase family [Acidimicrobiaceae bacterium]|nr:NAD(P)-dependent dehydrogenase, short-chain alcohol dehydrogenase family [Acidimicrobiaceae bacterium]
MSILNRFSLDGKVAIVTGASSGLGVAFATALAEAGASIAVGARRSSRLSETKEKVAETGAQVLAVVSDVSVPEDCDNLVAETMRTFGRVDILVNNAGIATAVPAIRENPDQFREIVEVNLMGSYWMAQACGRVMQPGSSIINIGSVLGLTTAGLPQAAYSASKAAVMGLTRDLAQQWTGRRGIRVNAVAPGFFRTEMTDEYPDGYVESVVLPRVPAGRTGEMQECAAVVVFLASEASSYITGVVLPVDGGMLIT